MRRLGLTEDQIAAPLCDGAEEIDRWDSAMLALGSELLTATLFERAGGVRRRAPRMGVRGLRHARDSEGPDGARAGGRARPSLAQSAQQLEPDGEGEDGPDGKEGQHGAPTHLDTPLDVML
jgi:hypothetical protein